MGLGLWGLRENLSDESARTMLTRSELGMSTQLVHPCMFFLALICDSVWALRPLSIAELACCCEEASSGLHDCC